MSLTDSLFSFAAAAGRERPRRMIIYGRPSPERRALLRGAATWDELDGIDEVVVAETLPQLLRLGLLAQGPSIVVPLRERQLRRYPRLFRALAPSRRAVRICHDKRRFARFAVAAGLGELVPRSFGEGEALVFPVVVKRGSLANGNGVGIVRSADELKALRRRRPWAGHRLLIQELVEGSRDLVTHCVAKGGRMVWHSSYEYLIDPAAGVQRPDTVIGRRRHALTAADQAQLERFLAALGYDGPATFDYRRRADGRLAVLEINARFGGSLFRPENTGDLRGALGAVIAHARPATGGRQ